MKVKISVVSYKRPKNDTCDALSSSKYNDWNVFVYSFDPFLEEYKKNYGTHIRVITELSEPSLPNKRQLVLNDAIKLGYSYCVMLDDDITNLENVKENKKLSIDEAIELLINSAIENPKYVALSACYNLSDNFEIDEYKNVCNVSIFNLNKLKDSKVKYNPKSKCEDMEFTIDLLLEGFVTGRLNYLLSNCILQGGNTNDGLSYRFSNINRFIKEGEYMSSRYPELKEVFEYDDSHFKMNTEKLKTYLQKNKLMI